MANNTKPHKRYRPRPVAKNPIELALRRVSKIPETEIDEVLRPIRDSFRALREGVANEDQWCLMAGSIELALSIERDGVIKGLRAHLEAAERALLEIGKRARVGGTWRPTALYWQEIDAIDDFVWMHRLQLEQLSEGEWRRAHDRAVALVLSQGGRALDIKVLELPEQLSLT